VFLLPCTVGPYVICGGILCSLSLLKAFPWLLLYNLIFIIPMLIITGLVYAGIAKVEDVSGWKDKKYKIFAFSSRNNYCTFRLSNVFWLGLKNN